MAARAELEGSSKWDDFLEMRGVLKALNTIIDFPDEVRAEMQTREEEHEHRS